METGTQVENTLSLTRFIQGKYLKDVEGLFPSAVFVLGELPMEVFLEFCETRGITIRPLSPQGFSQDFEVKRVFFQFPFGEFLKINAFRSKTAGPSRHNFAEIHEGIYYFHYKEVPFALANLVFYNTGTPGLLNQFLFVHKEKTSVKDELLDDFADYFTSKFTENKPFQIDTFIPYINKPARWSDIYGLDHKLEEYKAFIDSRLHPSADLLPAYEDALPSLTLIGPSGCGKSHFVNVLMTEYPDFKFFMFRPSEEITPFVALDFIERSKRFPRRVYLFEELDALAETMSGLQIWRYVIEEGVEKASGHVAMVVATSSYPDVIKTAVEYRPDLFGQVWRFDYPHEQARKQYVSSLLPEIEMSEKDWKLILEETDGFSYAWLKDVVRNAGFISGKMTDIQPTGLLKSISEMKSRVTNIRDKFPQGGLNRRFGFQR